MSTSTLKLSRHGPLYAALGVTFWLVAALLIRFLGDPLFSRGEPWLYVMFATCIPVGWYFILMCLAIGRVSRSEALVPVTIMCITGLLLDGIAISGFTDLYGASVERIMLGASWLLWGVGVLLSLGLYMQLRSAP